jgi:hypothetical protein
MTSCGLRVLGTLLSGSLDPDCMHKRRPLAHGIDCWKFEVSFVSADDDG